jgi:DNA polymerase-3 subunit gamma/tau
MAIGLCGEQLRADPIREMLGLAEANWIEDLTRDCLQGKMAPALAKVEEIYGRGYDLRQIAMQWVEYWHDLTLLKAAGREVLQDTLSEDKLKLMEATVAAADLDDLQVAAQTVYRSAEQIFRSEAPKILFDLLVVKLVHGSPYQSLAALLASPDAATPKPAAAIRKEGFVPPAAKSRHSGEASAPKPSPEKASTVSWGKDLLDRALKHLPQVKAVLDKALSSHWEGNTFVVGFERGSMWLEMFQEKSERLAQALAMEAGSPVQVLLKEESSAPPVSAPMETDTGPELPTDPVVRQAVEILNAKVKEIKKF